MREKFHKLKLEFPIAFFLLIAIFSGAVSLAFTISESENSAEMVYCPLTKKFQPVNPPKENSNKTLDAFCASNSQKDRFSLEISKQIHSDLSSLSEKQFEKIVFDYFQNGKSAFGNLPKLPEFPHENLAKNSNFAVNAGKNKENQFVWKLQNENFSFAQNPRPPDLAPKGVFAVQIIRNLDEISRNINPRSPPVLS